MRLGKGGGKGEKDQVLHNEHAVEPAQPSSPAAGTAKQARARKGRGIEQSVGVLVAEDAKRFPSYGESQKSLKRQKLKHCRIRSSRKSALKQHRTTGRGAELESFLREKLF